jgi:uncharacterized DUF497 family protein
LPIFIQQKTFFCECLGISIFYEITVFTVTYDLTDSSNVRSFSNKNKHGIDFNSAMEIWNDIQRVEIEASSQLENRSILIGKIGEKHWTAIPGRWKLSLNFPKGPGGKARKYGMRWA